MDNEIYLLGYASGIGANNIDCALGPWYLQFHTELFHSLEIRYTWKNIVFAASNLRGLEAAPTIAEINTTLANEVFGLVAERKRFCVLGGDHSSAIGTWSGLAHAYRKEGDIGLIWIDAHMDSHTPDSSETKNIHGMPLAHLLGKGLSSLNQILDVKAKLKPENICVIGARSYEAGEEALLKQLGVKIFYMDEIRQRNFTDVMQEAIHHVSKNTCGFGISFDLDAIDPHDAPGVGCRVNGGLSAAEVIKSLQAMDFSRLLGLEIAEYNPIKDHEQKTANLVPAIIEALYNRNRVGAFDPLAA